MFRLGKASDAQGVRKEFYGGVNVRDHPADLCEFESGDGVVIARPTPFHLCMRNNLLVDNGGSAAATTAAATRSTIDTPTLTSTRVPATFASPQFPPHSTIAAADGKRNAAIVSIMSTL